MPLKQKSRLERLGRSAFLLLGLVPVLLGATVLWSIVQFRAGVDQVEHSHRALTAIAALEASVTQAESSVRAYFVTNDPSYLEEFEHRRNDVADNAGRLRKLAQENSHQFSTIQALLADVAERLDFLKTTSELRKSGQSVDAINASHGVAGRRLIAAIQGLTEMARSEEERLLAQNVRLRRQIEIFALSLCGAVMLMGLAVALGGDRTIRGYRALRDRAEQELKSVNASLEERVAERTIELEQTNSDLREAKTELLRTTDALRRSNTGLESFAYAASHELQEPLRTITSCLQLLRKHMGNPDPESGSLLGFATDSAARMKGLVANLLVYSRVTQEFSRGSVSLEAVLCQVLQDLQAVIQEAGAVITNDPLPRIHGDEDGLMLLLQNLLSNSIKFRKPNEPPRIHVSARLDGQHWVISVRDNGIGFEPQYAARVFDMFQRLHSRQDFPGNGIGLALVKRIAEVHGGRVWAESEMGAGSVFCVSLPAAASAEFVATG
jgi:signal transduction histidine kinase